MARSVARAGFGVHFDQDARGRVLLSAVESTVERLGIGALRAFLLDETVTTGDLQKAA